MAALVLYSSTVLLEEVRLWGGLLTRKLSVPRQSDPRHTPNSKTLDAISERRERGKQREINW